MENPDHLPETVALPDLPPPPPYAAPGALGIKSWAEEDRPREKLQAKGRAALSDAELIAILLGSGTVKLSAVDVAKLMLQGVGNDLNALAVAPPQVELPRMVAISPVQFAKRDSGLLPN